jgi:tRNA A-37 threonylcarbamoyl transferase component Bud32
MTADIEQISRTGKGGFVLQLKDAASIHCLQTVRHMPGRRVVCRGQWNDQEVYAKIFIGTRAVRYVQRDLQGVQALAAAGILTPPLLHAGPSVDGKSEVLIFTAINDSLNAEQAWTESSADISRQFALAEKLVAEVAHHHNAGLMQTDLYLRNFLLQDEKVYTLDGDAVRKFSGWCSRRQALKNLALLLSKFDVAHESLWLPQLLGIYARERSWNSAPPLGYMRRRIAAIRRRVVGGYADSKVFRACTDIEVSRSRCKYQAIVRPCVSPELEQALANPDALVDEIHSLRLKSGNTCTVSLAEIDGRKMVVKRYNIKNFCHGLNRALRQSRAAVSWSNAHRLRMYDIATAKPIALVEKRCGPIRRQAYFLAEYVDAPDAAAFFADASVAQTLKTSAAISLAQLFYKLYLLNIEHGDFKAANVKILSDGQPLLIDLDSMREHSCRWLFNRRHVRDLRRFMQNWPQDSEIGSLLANAFKETYKDHRPLQRAGWL